MLAGGPGGVKEIKCTLEPVLPRLFVRDGHRRRVECFSRGSTTDDYEIWTRERAWKACCAASKSSRHSYSTDKPLLSLEKTS